MGIEFGTVSIYKKNGNDVQCIINGSIPHEEMKKCLDKFIELYVLCQECKYPEMVLRIRKEKVTGKCDSCGARCNLDNDHKIAKFIVSNPP